MLDHLVMWMGMHPANMGVLILVALLVLHFAGLFVRS